MSDVIHLPEEDRGDNVVETNTFQAIDGLFGWVCGLPYPSIALVVGAAGVGKTTAGREHARRNRAVFVTLSPQHATLRSGLWLLAERLEAESRQFREYGSNSYLFHEIAKQIRNLQFWRGSDGGRLLIIIDEAQHAEDKLIDSLRCLSDETECALALMGNPTIRQRLEKKGFEQVLSRVARSVVLEATQPGDIAAICRANGVVGARALARLQQAAAHSVGNLREVARVIHEARRIAGSGKPIDERAIAAAIDILS